MKLSVALFLAAALLAGGAHAESPLTLERISIDPPLAGRLPRQAEVSPGGHWVSFLRPSQADSEVLELWAQPVDAAGQGGEPRKLVAAADLLGGAVQKLSEAEKMALERQRISQSGITGYQWCGGGDGALLFPLSGDLYLVRLTAGGPQAQKLALEAGAPKQDPRCTPDGQALAYVQDGNLFVLPLAEGGKPRRLTSDGGATVSWGLAEFIAAEELSRQRGYWWSKDGRSLLALRVDESGVAIKTRAQIFADRTAMTEQRYPAAGAANARVTAFAIDAATGQRRELLLPAGAEYIARAGWFADGTPWLQWFTRDQTRLTLTEFKAGTSPRDITVETDPAWVEVHDDLIETPKGLLWSGEASGRRQLLLIDRASGRRTPLTRMPEPVAHAVCANDGQVVFAAAGDVGKAQELYSLPLAGGRPQPLPGMDGRQWRDAKADSGCTRLLVTRSAWGAPPRLELRSLGQEGAIALAGDPPSADLKAYTNTPLALALTAADGHTPLNAFFFAAQDRREGRHPVIVMAYGGPGAATVNWAWGRDMPLIAYWQQRGYGVLMLDTRGMEHRDREFTRAHHHAFGKNEVADLFAAVRELPGRVPGVDPARIGFFGWSYGGFLAARAVLDADTPFAASVAVAPVTDWTLYDTAYTERYLGLPEDGKAAAYAGANLPARAALLNRPLLLMHGTADDNVLFEHTLRLVEALQTAGKTFDLQIYPGKAHGIAGRAARLHLYRTMDAFFERHLKPGQ
ncbi:S9 family peptidase [Roseateles saccharophilus]|uniref:Dipeptidyl-peptidase-4 n=1 Tax=Roseateles saccharophilus TaxID=304 RepID=A0A4R3UJB0_ROSSA|nr:alpha/beta fold hydrolase [Roseateles saccharophilus]MDG0834334.1 S9 family peptidase [Roseateles saccharophilus]TCU90697.1 dipeptidyl-peptidase-4 [Roseateles saccharophilus]